MTTSDMMFYAKAAAGEEEKIRRAGLENLRKKVYEKMATYTKAQQWEKSAINPHAPF